jgi:putative aminopeptidase FrvX
MLDRVAFASRAMMKSVSEVASREGIPVQVTVTSGATDGAAIQTQGTAMIPLSVPVRYVHSPAEVMSLLDYHNLVRLLAAIAGDIAGW